MLSVCFTNSSPLQRLKADRDCITISGERALLARRSRCGGFALVIALSLMAFVLLLILSLISFISVEVQSAANGQERMQARENAYLGLQIALGNLQKYAGADQRSTARADIMADGNQLWTGVWNNDTSAPGYDPNAWPVWLVSGDQNLSLNDPSALSSSSDDVVEIVPSLSTASAVLVEKLTVQSRSESGNYAYWVGGEGSKAKFNKTDPYALATNPTTDKRRITVAQRNGIETVLPAYPVNDTRVDRTVSSAQLESLTGVAMDDYSHDFTALSSTLLTNPVDGGLKQDLSTVFQAPTLPASFAEHAVFVTPDTSIFGPRWEYLNDYFNAPDFVIDASGKLYPRPPYDSHPTRKGALDTDGGNGGALNPYLNVTSENDIDGWVKQPYFALTTELGLVLSVSKDSADLPVIRLHPFVELTNPYNMAIEGGWYEYHMSNFKPTITLSLSDSTGAKSPTTISKNFMTFLKNDIPAGNVMRMLIHSDQTEIEAGRSIRLFPAGIFNADNLRSYTDTEMPMDVATENSNWDDGYLEIRPTWDSGGRWPSTVAGYDTLSIDISFASSVESMSLAFYLQRYTQGVAKDSAITRGTAYIKNVNEGDNDYDFVMNWPPVSAESRSFALVRGKVKSADEYDLSDSSDFQGVYNPRSPLMNVRHGYSSDNTVRAWDWTFELGAVNPDFSTPGGTNSRYGYWGPSSTTGEGGGFDATRTVLYDVPKEPMISLGQFQNVMLSLYPHEPAYAFGNSYAPKNGLAKDQWYGTVSGNKLLDMSYAMNTALWDHFYFSSIPDGLSVAELSEPLPSSHIEISSALEGAELLTEIQTYDEAAAHLRINGGFNINSVSEVAWAAVLGSMAGLPIEDQASATANTIANAFLRNSTPFNGAGIEWSGFKEIQSGELYDTDPAVVTLARALVAEIKDRARSTGQGRPFASLSEFINRRLSDDAYGEKGAIQKAIEDADINNGTNLFAPGSVTQADLLSALGPKLTSRSDTFVIRGYGETVSPITGKPVASAICEAVVERQVEYLEPWDGSAAGNIPSSNTDDLSSLNQKFGRAFKVTAFRWIN